jgi:nucleoid-associated protein YgaU
MSRNVQRASWETRVGLGLIGGLLAVLIFVAWRRIDSLFADPSAAGIAANARRAELHGPTVARPWPGERTASPAPLSASSVKRRPQWAGGEPAAQALARPDEAPRASATIVGFSSAPDDELASLRPPIEPLQEDVEAPYVSPDDAAPVVTLERDSFWSIAERVYGDGAFFKALYHHNRSRFPFPDRLAAGEPVDTPSEEELRRLYPELCPQSKGAMAAAPARSPRTETDMPPDQPWAGRVCVVQAGESLAEVAERTLGRRSRWTEIYRLNKDRLGEEFENPPEGVVLVLPETARIADAYEPPGGDDRR